VIDYISHMSANIHAYKMKAKTMNWNKPLVRNSTIGFSRRVERILPKDKAKREEQLIAWLDDIHAGLRSFIDAGRDLASGFHVDCTLTEKVVARMFCIKGTDDEPISYTVAIYLSRERLEDFTPEAWVMMEIKPR
jgi:hypothetical protein